MTSRLFLILCNMFEIWEKSSCKLFKEGNEKCENRF